MSVVDLGVKVANFTLLNQQNQAVSLSDFAGQWVVIYFYPKASTPGCTTQACGMRDSQALLADLNVVTLGVSPDPVKRLQKFHTSQQLNFDLLSDLDHQLAELFGVWALKKFMGKEFMGVIRTSFILSPAGELVYVLREFKTTNHHQRLVEQLRLLMQNLSA